MQMFTRQGERGGVVFCAIRNRLRSCPPARLVCDEGRMKRQRHKVGGQHEWGSHAGTAAHHWSLSFGSSQAWGQADRDCGDHRTRAKQRGTLEPNLQPRTEPKHRTSSPSWMALLASPSFNTTTSNASSAAIHSRDRDVRPDCGSSRFPSSRRQLSDPLMNPRNPKNPTRNSWDCHFRRPS